MGIIFIIFIGLIIFEIFIRRDKISRTKENKNRAAILTKKQITILVILLIVLPIITIIALQTGIIGYDSEDVREKYETDLNVVDRGIYLTDENIKAKVYQQLSKPMDEKITREELNLIIEINNLKSESIDDLKHFRKLEKLVIDWTNDDSLLPIQNLNNLKYLSIKNAENIDNIDPIGNIKSLEYLEITSDNITNISPLENLDNLRELHLNTPQVRDLSSIKKILNLEILYINERLIEVNEL